MIHPSKTPSIPIKSPSNHHQIIIKSPSNHHQITIKSPSNHHKITIRYPKIPCFFSTKSTYHIHNQPSGEATPSAWRMPRIAASVPSWASTAWVVEPNLLVQNAGTGGMIYDEYPSNVVIYYEYPFLVQKVGGMGERGKESSHFSPSNGRLFVPSIRDGFDHHQLSRKSTHGENGHQKNIKPASTSFWKDLLVN